MPHFLKQEIHIKFTILQDYSQRSGESKQSARAPWSPKQPRQDSKLCAAVSDTEWGSERVGGAAEGQ
jgi:hypothetical protein